MNASATDFTKGPIRKSLVLFAIPLLLSNLFQQLYNAADSVIVGNFVGAEALAAVSSSTPLINLMVGFFNGMAIGAGVVIARYFGARDMEKLRKAIHTDIAFGIICGLLLIIAGTILTPHILRWMQTPEDIMPQSVEYFRIYSLGILFSVLYNIMMGIMNALGDSRHPLYYLIASSLINIVLDIVFIRYFNSGVAGAALATIISQFISALLCFIQITRTTDIYRLQVKDVRIDRAILLQIFHLGLPAGIQNSIVAFANVVVQSNINTFGEMAMAGFGAYSKIEGFGFLPITSFTMALTTFVSQNLGARQYDRVKKGTRFGILTIVLLAELIGLLVFVLAPQLISAFDSTPAVVEFGILKSRTAAPFFFLVACTHSFAAILRGAGKTVVSMVVLISTWCVVRVAFLSITIPLTHNIQMVCWVYPLTWFLSSAALFFYYKKADWIHSSLK